MPTGIDRQPPSCHTYTVLNTLSGLCYKIYMTRTAEAQTLLMCLISSSGPQPAMIGKNTTILCHPSISWYHPNPHGKSQTVPVPYPLLITGSRENWRCLQPISAPRGEGRVHRAQACHTSMTPLGTSISMPLLWTR
jgi:hypothetical protein